MNEKTRKKFFPKRYFWIGIILYMILIIHASYITRTVELKPEMKIQDIVKGKLIEITDDALYLVDDNKKIVLIQKDDSTKEWSYSFLENQLIGDNRTYIISDILQ